MRVLLIEDDPHLSRAVERILRRASIDVFSTPSGEDGISLGKIYEYDLVILDLGLPDIHGHQVLRRLRLSGIHTPILVLTGADDHQEMIKSFSFGADDYVTKPFKSEELIARVYAIVRRSRGHSHSQIRTGELVVNLQTKQVEAAGEILQLSHKEYLVLKLLSLRMGKTVTKHDFLNYIYRGLDEPDPKIVDVYVCKIRKKITQVTGRTTEIETVRGRGYLLRGVGDHSRAKLAVE